MPVLTTVKEHEYCEVGTQKGMLTEDLDLRNFIQSLDSRNSIQSFNQRSKGKMYMNHLLCKFFGQIIAY